MNGGGSYQHSGGSFTGPHQAQGEGRCSVLEVSSGMRLAILKQGISAVLACSVEGAIQNSISHALADLQLSEVKPKSLSCTASCLLQLAFIVLLL